MVIQSGGLQFVTGVSDRDVELCTRGVAAAVERVNQCAPKPAARTQGEAFGETGQLRVILVYVIHDCFRRG